MKPFRHVANDDVVDLTLEGDPEDSATSATSATSASDRV